MTSNTRTHISTLTLIVAIHFAAVSFLLPILPSLGERFLVPPMTLGWLEATFAITHLLALPVMGRLADRFGTRRTLTGSLVGQMLAFLLLALSSTEVTLFIARALGGASSAILPIAVRWVKHHLSKDDQMRGIAYVMLGVTIGASFGPLISGALGAENLIPPASTGLVASLVGILLVQRLPNEETRARKIPRPSLSPDLITLGIVFLLVSTGFHLYRILLPFYLIEELGKPVLYAGLALGALSIVAAITQALLTKTRTAKRLVSIYMLSIILMTLAFFLTSTGSVASLIMSLIILAIGAGLADPIGGALLTKLSHRITAGETAGAVFAIGALGKIFGPLLAGLVLTSLTTSQGFMLAGLVASLGVMLATKIR